MQAQTLASLFVKSQFNYRTTVRMFYSRKSKLQLEKTYKLTLRGVFKSDEKNYKDLLADYDEISIHQKHSQVLAAVVFIVQIN